MKTAVLYARVSSREQREEGYSIEAQQKLLREYAHRNSFGIAKEFIEVESAKAQGRKAFGEMLDFLRKTPLCKVVIVEKTDRLYRNFRDAVSLEERNVEIHLVKENSVISEDARSQAKFMHGIHLVVAKNYSDNLREEVKKGMAEKVAQGGFPHKAPFGYRNNPVTRTLELHPENAVIVRAIFTRYATGNTSLKALRDEVAVEFGKRFAVAYVHQMLQNPFYIGMMRWKGELYNGTHPNVVTTEIWERVQTSLKYCNKPKYAARNVAFRGLLTCANDGCLLTAEVKKEKYTYYRCTGYRGKCATPRFTESEIAAKLGATLDEIHVPADIVSQISAKLEDRQSEIARQRQAERGRRQSRLAEIESRMDRVFDAKLDGSIPEDVVQRKLAQLRSEADQVKIAIAALGDPASEKLLTAKRCLELANRASTLYKSQNATEQAKLLRMVLLNCRVDEVSLYPTYRNPFDLIFKRAVRKEWSGREDLNLRPPGPEPGALPG